MKLIQSKESASTYRKTNFFCYGRISWFLATDYTGAICMFGIETMDNGEVRYIENK